MQSNKAQGYIHVNNQALVKWRYVLELLNFKQAQQESGILINTYVQQDYQ